MPLITTHNYFAKEVFHKSKKEITNTFQDHLKVYELFAQGFDLFIFYDFFKWKKENLSNYFHTKKTDLFFIELAKFIKKEKKTHNSELLAALYGHLTHYILDSHCHPFIVYKSGIYDSKKKETYKYNGQHVFMEMQIDQYFYTKETNNQFKNFKIHKHLIPIKKLSNDLINDLNFIYKKTFNIENGGNKYNSGLKTMYYSYKYLIEDKTGIKRKLYQTIDFLIPNKSKFQYYSTYIKHINEHIFNKEHHIWYHPWLKSDKHQESFFDIYQTALKEALMIFEKTNLFLNDQISEEEYKHYLKGKSYLSGLPWKKQVTLKHLEF